MTTATKNKQAPVWFGLFETRHETISRIIPSPFSMLRKRDYTAAEQAVAAQTTACQKRNRRTASATSSGHASAASADTSDIPLDSTKPLLFGTAIRVTPDEIFIKPSSTLVGWTSQQIELSVPFSRVLRDLERRSHIAPTDLCVAPRGLVNTANDCFANAVLQMLVHCEPLRVWLEQTKMLVNELERRKGRVSVPTLLRVLLDVVSRYRLGDGRDDQDAWSPFSAPRVPLALATRVVSLVMPGRPTRIEQQDAQEFLMMLLTQLHDALLAAQAAPPAMTDCSDSESDEGGALPSSQAHSGSNGVMDLTRATSDDAVPDATEWTEVGPAQKKAVVLTREQQHPHTPISRLFRGRLRSTVHKKNSSPTITFESFNILSLDPTSAVAAAAQRRRKAGTAKGDGQCTLESLLSSYFEAERVALDGSAASARAAVATRGQRLDKNVADKQMAVEALPPTLIIHVARFAHGSEGAVKTHARVKFGHTLNVKRELFSAFAQSSPPALRYRLRAVVRHHGQSAQRGHYTSTVLVRTPSGEQWFLFNDASVDRVRPDDVLDAQDEVYMLCYAMCGDNDE